MDEQVVGVPSPPRPSGTVEEAMPREDIVPEIVARLACGERVKRIGRELGVDRRATPFPQRKGVA